MGGEIAMAEKEVVEEGRLLARKEGIFAGFSSGANLAAALRLLRGQCKGQTVVIVLSDTGLKYVSTDLWPSH
jgi:cysteine synthase A